MDGIALETRRFRLRSLVEDDATPHYLAWLEDADAKRNIHYARQPHDLTDLRAYISARRRSQDAAFLGIFDKASGTHIGNIKFEPIHRSDGWAVMGILIGEFDWRGKGVAPEVLEASGRWLHDSLGIRQILLGVSRDNSAAIRAYEKAGFRRDETRRLHVDPKKGLAMARLLP